MIQFLAIYDDAPLSEFLVLPAVKHIRYDIFLPFVLVSVR